MDMQVTELDGATSCVRLDGRLDAAGADAIGLRFTATVAGSGRPVLVDLSGCSFVASMGIRLLLSSGRALQQKGGKMVLFGAQPLVQSVFEDAALDQLLTLVATQADALAALSA
jgi:anti-sigma B factor antagonist